MSTTTESTTGPVPAFGSARGWTITVLLALFMLINFSDKAVLGLSAVSLRRDLGISPAAYGLIATSFFFLFSASALLIGFVANRISTKWILFVMALAWSVAQLPLLIPAAGYTTMIATRILLGAAEGPAVPLTNHAAHKWFINRDRSVVTNVVGLGVPVGVMVAAPVLSWTIADHGWRLAFGLTGAIGLAWALAWALVGKEGPVKDTVDAPPATTVDAPPNGESSIPSSRILRTGTWLGSVAGSFGAAWASAMLVAWVPSYLTTVLHYSTREVGSVIILPWAIMAAGMIGQGLFTHWLLRRGVSSRRARGAVGGLGVLVAGVALIMGSVVATGPLQLVLIGIGFGLGAMIIGIGQTTSAEICPTDRRGGVLGTYAAVYALAGVIAPVLTGELVGAYADPRTGYTIAFVITGLLQIVGGVLAVLFVRPERDRARLAEHHGADRYTASPSAR
ncbi:MFS transporter [Kribbella sp. NPDC051620]|uniref:MFS transporter n=1 Tax=Kribbella sp. NPDC051620 TaxID=3364120 RepID=UPI0037A76006